MIHRRSTPADKIALFRSLFRGREDVFPRRFENAKTGKSGYAPVCGNEWARGLCHKPKVKCAECPARDFLPVTDAVIHAHLIDKDEGGKPFVAGIYPMMLDETCFFLAADFDGKAWQDDITAFRAVCRRHDVPVAVERSRSGNGGHAWIFFVQAIPAALARRLGTFLLTETLDSRPGIGLASYDRLFPNQDTLPQGGFGSLIALPLQGQVREQGNSVFLDDDFRPHEDQWAFLSSIRMLDRMEVEGKVAEAVRQGTLVAVRMAFADDDARDPWTLPPSRRPRETPLTGPLPEVLNAVLADGLYFRKDELTPTLRNRLVCLAAFQNPEFYRKQAMRLSTYATPRVIACAEEYPEHIALPRGSLDDARTLLADAKIGLELRDERHPGTPEPWTFHGELRSEQQKAIDALARHDTGVLSATTAFGKTVVAAWMIAQRGVNVLVVVHTKPLLEQWIERLSAFLGIPAKSIGRFGGGKKNPSGHIDVGLMQSLIRRGVVDDRVGGYGHVIFDECHHLSAPSFEAIARRVKAKYVLGLSATVARKDGHHPVIFMQCGPMRHRVDAKEQAATRAFAHLVHVHPTSFRPPDDMVAETDKRKQFQQLYAALAQDPARNAQIVEDALAALSAGRSPVILTERTDHLDALAALLGPRVENLIVLQGGMGKKALTAARRRMTEIPAGEPRLLLAMGRFIGEGFDDARLDTLFLALPVSWKGIIAQYAGRLHRDHEGKREVVIHDYADLNVAMFANMFDRRCLGYTAIGYDIQMPASAVPGWPPEVPLPVDPVWKRDYAAAVRRLVRDGVDTHLGNLFVHAARQWPTEADDANRARSASEAFLFRRLETLPETKGRFRLNQKLPIPFDGFGEMEVDLSCKAARIVVEIDGPQHLGDADAYRRDRRKDHLLQENGWLVLRFLATDLAQRLDGTLDAILRAVSNRVRP